MDDVLALSQHVDYWDHLGWKDPYANPRSTQRQREYARSLRLRYVYTPQMVLDGSHDFVGTNRNDILAYIDSKPSRPRPAIHIGEDSQGKWQVVGIDAIIQDHLADIWLIEFDRQHQTIVKRGENRGRHLTNYNVVRRLEKIGRWRNVALNLPISGTDCRSPSHGCAVLLQGERSGRILAAAKIISDQN